MGLREDIDEWRQPDGLIVPKNEHVGTEDRDATGDGIKLFCLYHALLVKRGESRPKDLEEFERVIRSCFVRSGLPNRSPTKLGEQISKDALIAIGYAARLLKSNLAYEVLNRGNSSRFLWLKWFYGNMWPKIFDDGVKIPFRMIFSIDFWRSWMGKNPETICHIQFAGLPPGHEPHMLRKIWLCFFLMVSSVTRGTIYSLSYMMCETAYGHSSFVDFFIDVWRGRIDNAGGMKKRLAEELENNHSLVRYWK